MSEKVVHVIAGSEEQAKEWMEERPVEAVPAPPIAQDFTQNPFNAAPIIDVPGPDIPIKNVDLPTSEEEESWLNKARAKLGLKGGFKHVEELTTDKLKLVEDGSKLASSVLSAVLGLMFTLAGDEYELLAPTESEALNIIKPLIKIYARHSTLVNEISPDYIDASSAVAGIAIYAKHVVKTMREIKEMKARGYVYQKPTRTAPAEPEPEEGPSTEDTATTGEPHERYRQYGDVQRTGRGFVIANPDYEPAAFPPQIDVSVQDNGRIDIRGFAAIANGTDANIPGSRPAATFAPSYTSEEQRRQHEALRRLTARDVSHRMRRAGLI